MDVARVQEIVRSEEKIQVTYQGKSVWIDDVDESTATARVHTERNPAQSEYVAISQLEEA